MSGIRGAWCKIHKASIKLKRKQAVFLIQNFCAKLQKKKMYSNDTKFETSCQGNYFNAILVFMKKIKKQ